MIEFAIFIWFREFGKSVISADTVRGKNAKDAFNKARKLLPQVHSSIRVERKNDPTTH